MPFDEVAFATERSNNAAKAANENSRPMAQYALLINGAAASAVIAFLSREHIDPGVYRSIPIALFSYAFGVIAGAIAMFCMTESLDYWNAYWERIARGQAGINTEWEKTKGILCWGAVRLCVGISIVLFAYGSAKLALALIHSPVPVSTSCDPALSPG